MIDKFTGKYRFLSNFWRVPIMFDGEIYPSVEHAYQAAKTNSLSERESIRKCFTSGDAKRIGRTVTIRPEWGQVKLTIMEDLLRSKFINTRLSDRLLATGDEELVEGNNWGDDYWGKYTTYGMNHLGQLLQKIRKEISKT